MNNKGLIISICIFMIVGMCALLLILNKGHIGTIGLVKLEEDSVEESSVFKIETKSKYLSSKDKEKTDIIATIDGVILKEQVEYVSSDENIAKIVDGNLVAVKDGKVTITANYNGKTASTQVHVITPIKNINFTTTSKSIRVGKELQMKLKVTPSDADISTLKYISSDDSIAIVNANGIVTGVSAGKVTITVIDEFTGVEKSVDLTIRK